MPSASLREACGKAQGPHLLRVKADRVKESAVQGTHIIGHSGHHSSLWCPITKPSVLVQITRPFQWGSFHTWPPELPASPHSPFLICLFVHPNPASPIWTLAHAALPFCNLTSAPTFTLRPPPQPPGPHLPVTWSKNSSLPLHVHSLYTLRPTLIKTLL